MNVEGIKKDFYMSSDKRLLFLLWPEGSDLPEGAAHIGENILLGVDTLKMLYPGIQLDQKAIASVLKGHHMSKLFANRALAWSVKEGKWVG